jgi:hypothetical protein
VRKRGHLDGKAPFCEECGKGSAHVTSRPGGGHRWLCASCEYRESHPDALEGEPPTLEAIKAKTLPLQTEKLF